MRKHIPGLHSGHQDLVSNLEDCFCPSRTGVLSLASPEALLCTPFRHPGAHLLRGTLLFGTTLLH